MYVGDADYSKDCEPGNEEFHGVVAVTYRRSESTELEGSCPSEPHVAKKPIRMYCAIYRYLQTHAGSDIK